MSELTHQVRWCYSVHSYTVMRPAKSIAILTVISLLISIALPLTAFAASEITVSVNNKQSISGTTSVSTKINSSSSDIDKEMHEKKREMEQEMEEMKRKMDEKMEMKDKNIFSEKTDRSVTGTPRATGTPTSTPTASTRTQRTPTPTKKTSATPTPTKKPTATPTSGASDSADEKKTYIMHAINTYRKSKGLSPVQTDPYTCSFAKIRAQEITRGFNHDGFSSRIKNSSLPYPSYSQVTENIAMTSDYKKVVSMWINSPGHAENMRRNTPYVCVESSGNYYAYEGWRP